MWKRYTFHAEYILTEPLKNISDDDLFLREEAFLCENTKFVNKPELFKFCDFLPEKKELVLFRTKLKHFLIFLISIFIGMPLMLIGMFKMISAEVRGPIMYGAAINAYLIASYLLRP